MTDNSEMNRLSMLFDDGVFTELDAFAKSSEGDAEVKIGYGLVCGIPCYAFSQLGEITLAHCAKIKKAYDLASKTGSPIIGVYRSNGVRLTEGFEVLSAYGDILKASASVSGVIPQIAIVEGACLGISALMANMSDVVIALKESDFSITVPTDITAEENAKAGTVDIVAESFAEAVEQAGKLVSYLPENNLCPAPVLRFTAPQDGREIADEGSTLSLKSDYARNVETAFATVNGSSVGIITFGGEAVCPACAYKAEAFVKLCDAFHLPLITVADADGFKRGEEAQVLIAATKLTSAYASATCPKISLIKNNAVAGAYIALAGKGANADLTFAWDGAVVSPMQTDSAVAFLWEERLANGESRTALEKEYKETIGSAFTAAASGAVDDVFSPELTRSKIIAALDMLSGKRETTIPRKHSIK